jgi:hypothetical protein
VIRNFEKIPLSCMAKFKNYELKITKSCVALLIQHKHNTNKRHPPYHLMRIILRGIVVPRRPRVGVEV